MRKVKKLIALGFFSPKATRCSKLFFAWKIKLIPVAVVNGVLTVDRHQRSVASVVMVTEAFTNFVAEIGVRQKVLPQELINPEICLTKRLLLENLKVHRRKLQMWKSSRFRLGKHSEAIHLRQGAGFCKA